jgi:Fe-S-cluster containining protein
LEQEYIKKVKGKRFTCTECGKCCTGKGEVWMDTHDIERLADRLSIKTEIFLSRYVKSYTRKPGYWLLRSQRNPTQVWLHLRESICMKSPETTLAFSMQRLHSLILMHGVHMQDCIFLRDGLCTVHDAKPLQCATYPWWPDLMSQSEWNLEREQVCEGINHQEAQECDAAQAAAQLKAATDFFAQRDASRASRQVNA